MGMEMIPYSYHGAGSRVTTRVGEDDGGGDVVGGPPNPAVQGRGLASDDVAQHPHELRRASRVSGGSVQQMILMEGSIAVA